MTAFATIFLLLLGLKRSWLGTPFMAIAVAVAILQLSSELSRFNSSVYPNLICICSLSFLNDCSYSSWDTSARTVSDAAISLVLF